jgi:AcrR family transcriptional regulator
MEHVRSTVDRYDWLDRLLATNGERRSPKQTAILRAAIILFAEKGFASTSTREIASMAGVAEGTIFKLYATKKDLMLTVTEMIINDFLLHMFQTGLTQVFDATYENFEAFFTAFMKSRLALLEQGIPIFRIIIQEIPFHPEIQRIMAERIRQIRLPDLFRPYRDRGELSEWTDPEIFLLIATSVGGYINTRFVMMPELFAADPNYDPEKDMECFIRFVVRGLSEVSRHE